MHSPAKLAGTRGRGKPGRLSHRVLRGRHVERVAAAWTVHLKVAGSVGSVSVVGYTQPGWVHRRSRDLPTINLSAIPCCEHEDPVTPVRGRNLQDYGPVLRSRFV